MIKKSCHPNYTILDLNVVTRRNVLSPERKRQADEAEVTTFAPFKPRRAKGCGDSVEWMVLAGVTNIVYNPAFALLPTKYML